MWKSFVEGYKESGAPEPIIVVAKTIGNIVKVAMYAAVAISVARCMGVPV